MIAYLQKTEGSEGFHQIMDFLNTSHIRWEVKTVTEASIRRHLKLEDSDGISNFPTTEIFEQLALMGNMRKASKGYTRVDITLFPTMLVQGLIFQGEGSTVPVESHHTPTGAPSTSQLHISPTLRSSIRQETEVPQPSSPPHTNIADKAASIGVGVRYGGAATTTKKVYGAAFTKLIKKVKRLEKKDKLSKSRRKLRLVLSDEEDSDILAHEDPSKQERKIAQIDEDEGITLVQMGVSTASIDFITANVPVTTDGAEISIANHEVKTAGDSVDDIATESLVYIRRSAAKTKDKVVRLQKEFDKEERQRIARVHKVARSFSEVEWEDIQADNNQEKRDVTPRS
ncbi:hypothetical protein Tco_1217750 [Tanacetum coccineum]